MLNFCMLTPLLLRANPRRKDCLMRRENVMEYEYNNDDQIEMKQNKLRYMSRRWGLLSAISWVGWLLSCTSCSSAGKQSDSTGERSVYYWKTTFEWSDWEQEFIQTHQINRIYLRLFDVVYGYDRNDNQRCAVPEATIRFNAKVPEEVDIVPVVYITQDAILHDAKFAELLYKRIRAMATKHGFFSFNEVQLDCDWTKGSRDQFFGLCREMRDLLRTDSVTLSATIRLHQLSDSVPPVDRGVLMLYNTRSLYDSETENSILHDEDVKPYLKQPIQYSLPLALAYPTYHWFIAYRKDQFLCILRQCDVNDGTHFRNIQKNQFEVIADHYQGNRLLEKGDIVRREVSSFEEIMSVKRMVSRQIQSSCEGSVVYHLDHNNLSRYDTKQLDKIWE